MKVQGGAGVAAPSPPAWRAASDDAALPPNAQPMLIVRRGNKIHRQYPIYEGHNFIGRIDEKPVDIDLEGQEPPDRVLASRQHAVITFEDGKLVIEDLNSTNGTFVNRTRVQPGHKRPLQAGDLVQIGAVQLQLKV
jgi:pSer/pThr/pTyr-binding forkhead associated (FHA) protein